MGRDALGAKTLVTTNSRGAHVPDLKRKKKKQRKRGIFFAWLFLFPALHPDAAICVCVPSHKNKENKENGENKVWCNGMVLSAFLEDTSSDIPAAYTSPTATYTYAIASDRVILKPPACSRDADL